MIVSEKVKCIGGRNKTLSISRQCELLQLPRSFYYRQRSSLTEWPENLELMRIINEEFLRHPFYGSRKMTVYLNRKGISVNRKRIQRLIRLMGLESVAPKPNTSRQRKGHRVYPFLLKKMSLTEHDQVWYSDLTYIRLAHGFVYMTAVMWIGQVVMCCPGKFL